MRTAILHNFLIEANLMAGIAIILMMILRKTLRRPLGNSAICFGWLLVALRLLLPISFSNPWIHSIRSSFATDVVIRPIAGQILVRTRDALSDMSSALWRAGNDAGTELTDQLINSINYGNAGTWLMRIYLIGAALVLAWFVFCNVRFRMKLRAGQIEPISGKLLDQYKQICQERGVKPVPVVLADPLPSACLVGAFKPCIAIPLTASSTDAVYMLTHEVCHLRNHDHCWNVLRLICCVLHWFNPLVWIAANMSRTDTELRCDDRVISLMNEEQRKAYANVLVLAAAHGNPLGAAVMAAGMTISGKKLKSRVLNVLKVKKPLYWLSAVFTVLASMCFVCAFATSELPKEVANVIWNDSYMTSGLSGYQINSKEDAAEIIQSIWKALGHEEMALCDVVWNEETECYFALIRDDQQNYQFACDFDHAGHIIACTQFPQELEMPLETYEDLGELDQYKAMILNMLEQINPGFSARVSSIVFTQKAVLTDGCYYTCNVLPINEDQIPADLNVIIMNDGTVQLMYMSCAGNG